MLARYDPRAPQNAGLATAVEAFQELDAELGISLIHLALVLSHPTMTSAIIGPRTMEHPGSQLGAVAVDLGPEVRAGSTRSAPPGTDMMPLPPTTRAELPPLPRRTKPGLLGGEDSEDPAMSIDR